MKPLAVPVALLAALLLGGCKAKPAEPVAASRPAIDPWAQSSGVGRPAAPSRDRTTATSSSGTIASGRLPKGAVVEVRVVAVTDGDTVKVLTADNIEIKMRLNGIDAPESKMPFGTQAKKRLSDLVFDKTVTAKIEEYDRYGRAVGRLTLGGESVNARMVLDGYAWWYRTYAPKDHELETDEAQARSARRGLWSQSNPQKPWEWRKAKRERSAANSAR